MTKPHAVPDTYRGRDQMTLQEFIEDVEACNFRSPMDSGANHNAMFVWNILRNFAGMEDLTEDDLIQRCWPELSLEDGRRALAAHRKWYEGYSTFPHYAQMLRSAGYTVIEPKD